MTEAPLDWSFHLFPLSANGEERLSLAWVSAEGLERITRARLSGDRAQLGNALHWAHRLKAARGTDGLWPLVVNARTGEAIGLERTGAPAAFFAALGDLLNSTEFDQQARTPTPPGG